MPSIPVDWPKVEMHNWNQYTAEVVASRLNLMMEENPTIQFLPVRLLTGNDPIRLYCSLLLDCNEVAKHLEQIFDMQIGKLELSSKGEWVIYNPLAKAITNEIGRVTLEGVGKINSSFPVTNLNSIIQRL